MLKVSVIIPTYNRERCIIDLLECLFVQDYPEFEIIVVDQSDALTNDKKQMIARSGRLKYYWIAERGRSLAKNYGILFSSGDIVLFCDDDIIVPTNFISTHVKIYDNEQVAAQSCRLIEEGQPAPAIKKPLRTTFFGQLINKPYSTVSGYVTSLNGGNMSFRKSVLDQIGFFEEYFTGTSMVEEPDMAYRIIQLKHRIFFNASITVQHYPQFNGNAAEMKGKRASWFYFYFFNLGIFYLKYKRTWNMFFVFVYCIALSLKHTVSYGLGPKDYIKMVSGYFDGLRRGLSVGALPSPKGKYYTPVRYEKRKYNPITVDSLS